VPDRTFCLFCPNKADSREHLFPDWLNEVLGYVEPTYLFLGKKRGWRSDKPATHKLRVVCEVCNTGWMSGIERAAQPILTPMILGQPRHLTIDEQRTIATWAFSRTVVGEQLSRSNVAIPEADRLWLRDHHEPPPHARVFAAGTDGRWWLPGSGRVGNVHFSATKMIANLDQTHISPALAKDALVGYSATILVRHLALQVVATVLEGGGLAHPAELAPFLVQIWPAQVPVDGPFVVMTRPEVEHLIATWRGDAPYTTPWVPSEVVAELANRPNRSARRAARRAKKGR
jgi:hypothetical protein